VDKNRLLRTRCMKTYLNIALLQRMINFSPIDVPVKKKDISV